MNPHLLARRDLRRLVSEMWPDERCNLIAPKVLDAAIAAEVKSLDRAVLTAYLRHFPTEHPAFDRLRAASSLAAGRRDWVWRDRGERWALWDAQAGPGRLAQTLLETDDPLAAMRGAGLDGDLAHGEFVAEAIEAACARAGKARGEEAQQLGERLIVLFERTDIAGRDAMLASGLLTPWLSNAPPKAYQDRMGKLMVARVGDPRFDSAKWDALLGRSVEAQAIITLLRRWLTDQTVREFFKVVTHTTDDLVQWRERETFWLAYLDAELIDDAWFALGTKADDLIRSKGEKSEVGYGLIEGSRQYADPSHSSLILSIGDLRIAEWSHSGACRFWRDKDRTAPKPYGKKYFGYQLRAMNGGTGFEQLSHWSGWQKTFSSKVHEESGRQHPKHGAGYRTQPR